jgi:hypothetical protein
MSVKPGPMFRQKDNNLTLLKDRAAREISRPTSKTNTIPILHFQENLLRQFMFSSYCDLKDSAACSL